MADVPNRVCIIGAGSSGITAAKALKEKDIPFDCYEAGEQVGGNWVYENKNGMSSAYKSLFINTSRERMQYSDFPMPDHYPVFPHHTHIAEYFNNYVEHFNVRPHIRFNTKVMAAEPLENGGWEITLDDGSQHRYRALMVANGHHWDIRWPEPPFEGTLMDQSSTATITRYPIPTRGSMFWSWGLVIRLWTSPSKLRASQQ